MSNTTITTYTTSINKRPDLTGKPDQVFKFTNFMDHLIGGIRAETIAATGTVTPGLLGLQNLYAQSFFAICPANRLPSLETARTNRASLP